MPTESDIARYAQIFTAAMVTSQRAAAQRRAQEREAEFRGRQRELDRQFMGAEAEKGRVHAKHLRDVALQHATTLAQQEHGRMLERERRRSDYRRGEAVEEVGRKRALIDYSMEAGLDQARDLSVIENLGALNRQKMTDEWKRSFMLESLTGEIRRMEQLSEAEARLRKKTLPGRLEETRGMAEAKAKGMAEGFGGLGFGPTGGPAAKRTPWDPDVAKILDIKDPAVYGKLKPPEIMRARSLQRLALSLMEGRHPLTGESIGQRFSTPGGMMRWMEQAPAKFGQEEQKTFHTPELREQMEAFGMGGGAPSSVLDLYSPDIEKRQLLTDRLQRAVELHRQSSGKAGILQQNAGLIEQLRQGGSPTAQQKMGMAGMRRAMGHQGQEPVPISPTTKYSEILSQRRGAYTKMASIKAQIKRIERKKSTSAREKGELNQLYQQLAAAEQQYEDATGRVIKLGEEGR